MVGVVRGFEYLYEKVNLYIVYCDIKFSNILIFGDGVVKIVEFDFLNEFDMVVCFYSSRIFGIFSYYVFDE